MLSLLVALVSVSGIAIPAIINALGVIGEEVSKVEASVLRTGSSLSIDGTTGISCAGDDCTMAGIVYLYETGVLVSNSGKKAGAVMEGTVKLERHDSTIAKGEFALESVVKPGGYRLEHLKVPLTIEDKALFPISSTFQHEGGGVLHTSHANRQRDRNYPRTSE